MSKNRNYSCKDVDMLMASKTIAESFKANITGLSAIRTDWTEQYANDLILRIDNGIEKHLGIDAKKELRNATTYLGAIQIPAKRDVSFFKTQIDDDFKNDPSKRDEILKMLGFPKHLRNVQKSNQEALIQLLYTFKTNMTESLKKEITAKGMNASLIENIIGYADTFKQANITQESFKESTKEISKEASDSFNAIYDEIIGICKKASSYYRYEPLKIEQFTFSKVLTNLGAARKISAEKQPIQQA
jgi:hypothetical protein